MIAKEHLPRVGTLIEIQMPNSSHATSSWFRSGPGEDVYKVWHYSNVPVIPLGAAVNIVVTAVVLGVKVLGVYVYIRVLHPDHGDIVACISTSEFRYKTL